MAGLNPTASTLAALTLAWALSGAPEGGGRSC